MTFSGEIYEDHLIDNKVCGYDYEEWIWVKSSIADGFIMAEKIEAWELP